MNINADIVFAKDIKETLGISDTTLKSWLRDGKLPPPDVRITQRTRYWLRSTLVKAKVLPPIPEETHQSA